MVKALLKTQADSITVLYAGGAAANPCIFLEKTMTGNWKGKTINYTPGRLMVGLRSGASLEKATQLIEQHGGTVDFISNKSIDVLVEPRRTLDVARSLDGVGHFRFVTPEIVYNTANERDSY